MLFSFAKGAPTLGSLPPPSQLNSVPEIPGERPQSIPVSQHLDLGSGTSQAPPFSHSVSLSTALEPMPHRLTQRIRSGTFVEMRDLLTDNIALYDQIEVVYGQTPIVPIPGVPRSRFRDVPTMSSWLYCFLAYVAVRTTDDFTRNMLTYARLITREALRHGGSGWQDHDRDFWHQVEIDTTLPLNTLLPDLQSTTILGHRTGSGTFYVLCRSVDHVASQCALQWLQNPTVAHITQAPANVLNRRQ